MDEELRYDTLYKVQECSPNLFLIFVVKQTDTHTGAPVEVPPVIKNHQLSPRATTRIRKIEYLSKFCGLQKQSQGLPAYEFKGYLKGPRESHCVRGPSFWLKKYQMGSRAATRLNN